MEDIKDVLKRAEVSYEVKGKKPVEKAENCDKLREVAELYKEAEAFESGGKALEAIVVFRKIAKVLEGKEKNLLVQANVQFAGGDYEAPYGAKIEKYTPRCRWKYTEELEKRAEELEQEKKQQQLTGEAEKIIPKFDPKKSKAFRIKV